MKLNNTIVAKAIGAFLRRLRREGRNPDRWETEQATRAMAFLASDRYLYAIDHIDNALIPSSNIEEGTRHLAIPDLATLQGILDEICYGAARGSMDGRTCPGGQVGPFAKEKARSGAG
jgi:hypothetical protein